MKYISLVFVISSLLTTTCSGQINRPPEFVKGGDMDKFSLKEDTLVGSSVYTLRARDPENTRVHYYISGDSLSVERDTGVTPAACQKFEIRSVAISNGRIRGEIYLTELLIMKSKLHILCLLKLRHQCWNLQLEMEMQGTSDNFDDRGLTLHQKLGLLKTRVNYLKFQAIELWMAYCRGIVSNVTIVVEMYRSLLYSIKENLMSLYQKMVGTNTPLPDSI
ncbi:cadherin-23 [Trichonephila clavata]|uniref:Cadherin-23 n=1 Tax=Trichonephila clavata TaxID=2740835 RepID=A0A8X6K5L9_TRICU|nr:cadherin-23 [Trichonephila clavata]